MTRTKIDARAGLCRRPHRGATRTRIAVVSALLAGACSAPAPVDAPAVPVALDLHGAPVDPLASDAAATVLVFVSTRCPLANRYAPTLRTLAADWAARGVRAWLVYPDPDDDPAAIAAHQAAFDLPLPTARDPHHTLVARAGARVTPEAAVFVPYSVPPVYLGRIDDRVQELGKVRAEAATHELRDAVDAVLRDEPPLPSRAPAIGCYISDLR